MKDRSIALSRSRRKAFVAGVPVMPMYAFALLFVAGPLVYMVILSFLKRAEIWGILHEFTIENLCQHWSPSTSRPSTSLMSVWHSPDRSHRVPVRLLHGKLYAEWKRHVMLLLMIPWTACSGSTDGSSFSEPTERSTDTMGMGLMSAPLKLLYTYPAVVVGMVYALVPFMTVVYPALRADWQLISSRDLALPGCGLDRRVQTDAPGLLSGVVLTHSSMGLSS